VTRIETLLLLHPNLTKARVTVSIDQPGHYGLSRSVHTRNLLAARNAELKVDTPAYLNDTIAIHQDIVTALGRRARPVDNVSSRNEKPGHSSPPQLGQCAEHRHDLVRL
jgi:hypothetical protein